MRDFAAGTQFGKPETPHRKSRAIWWILGGLGVMWLLVCGGLLSCVMYLGVYGPETSVYTGNRVPGRFVETMKQIGALEEGEQILFFYSDALVDILDGFYFVSDRKVAVYLEGTGEPLTTIAFEQIEDLELYRDESFFADSEITLYLNNGQIVSFPVSSEFERDVQFCDAIRDRVPGR